MTGGVMFGLKHDIELLKDVDMNKLYEGPEGERDVKAMWFVWHYLSGVGTNSEPEIMGFSVSHTPRGCRLTVRADFDGIRRVAFITEPTPIGCVRTFARWVLEDRVKWHLDKFH